MKLPSLDKADVLGKRAFVRLDLDVPLEHGKIIDDSRLKAGLPTVEYLLKNNASVVVGGHLGRPNGVDEALSLEPVAKWFREILKQVQHDINKTRQGEFNGWEIGPNIFLLENLRFYEGEEKNDQNFAKKLASLADIYVNDAFAMCHRNHASIVGITNFLAHYAGLHLQKEVEFLSQVFEQPKRPLVVIVGGKKIETKLPLISKMYGKADYILVGGKIAEEHKEFLKLEHAKINPPADGKKTILLIADLNPGKNGILENSLLNFLEIISLSKTIIWNGTLGLIENGDDLNHATKRIAEGIIESKAFSVVGGGDTTEFLREIKLIDKFSFSSTGGGAMLAFLSGEKLPGLEALKK